MTGVVGLGQRAMAGRTGPDAAAKAAVFDHLGLQVTPANVLGVYAVIMQEVARLEASVQRFQNDYGQGMPLLGGDPVSLHASRGFTEVTNQLLGNCQTDIDDLQRLGDGLVEAARAYGKTEEQIRNALNAVNFHYRPASLPPLLNGLIGQNPLGGATG
jgi:hypothetical protein